MFPSPIFVQAENATSVLEAWAEDLQTRILAAITCNPTLNAISKTISTSYLRAITQCNYRFEEQSILRRIVFRTQSPRLICYLEQEVVRVRRGAASNIGEAAGKLQQSGDLGCSRFTR